MESILRLLAAMGATTAPGASEAALEAFESATGLRLPAAIRALYAASDGAAFEGGRLKFLPLAEVQQYVEAMQNYGIPASWGYFPFTDSSDSNPFCVCCTPPLTGYIVQVFHDDSAALKFRSLDSFLAALRELVTEDGPDITELPSEFDREARTTDNIKIGRELLRIAPELEDVEQEDAYRFGMWLLSGNEISEIVSLLQVGNEYVRDDAAMRLAALGSLEASQALQEAEKDMVRFVEQCAAALHQAGVAATIIKGTNLEAGPRNAGVNTRMYYSVRNEPGVFDRLVEQFRS